MIVDDDPVVARLRRESASVHVAGRGTETVLRGVHERRRVQRQHRVQAFAALGVVAIAVVGALIAGRDWTAGPQIASGARPVAEWPVRGSLAADADLIARAEQTWRASPHRPSGAVRALFAGTPPYSGTANFAVVALASAEGSVAFVTTPVARKTDTAQLLLRAVTRVSPGQSAVGFVAVEPDPRDEAAGVAFALAAPGPASPELVSSAVDVPLGGGPQPLSDGSLWQQVAPGVGAWNSVLEVAGLGAAAPAAGLLDPETSPVRLRAVVDGRVDGVAVGVRDGVVAEGASAGDLVVTPVGVLGVVADSLVVDTRLSALGPVSVPGSGVTGTLSDSGRFTPSGGAVYPTNRVVLTRGDVEVVVGRVVADGDGWRVERAVDPGKLPEVALRVRAG